MPTPRRLPSVLGATATLVAVSAASACAQTPARIPAPGGAFPDAVSMLTGCWVQPGASGLREQYAPPAANMMTGLSQFWRGGAIVDWEFHRIDAGPDGPVLTPHPRGVASVSFGPAEVAADRIVWENLEHDFPQRIIYHRVAPDSLVVRVEGGEGDGARSMEWRMARAECGG